VRRWSKKNVNGIKFLNLGYVLFAPWLRIIVPRSRILARPGNTISAEIKFLPVWQRPFYWSAYQIAFLCADMVVAQSQTMARDLKKTFFGIGKKIRILPNPVAPALLAQRNLRKGAKMPHEPYIFCAMSFKPQKDFRTLIRGYKNLLALTCRSTPLLVIAGRFQGKKLKQMVRQELGENHAQKVRLVGELGNPNPWTLRSRFCVLSSHEEGSSNFLLEAVYHKKAVVATDCPGANREMAGRFAGIFLSRPNDPASLAHQMHRAYRKPMFFRTGTNRVHCREFSRQLFDIFKGT